MHPLPLFQYNWKVREQYFETLAIMPAEELTKVRAGGFGSILRTLAHIVLVEQDWIRTVLGIPAVAHDLDAYTSLEQISELSDRCRADVEGFVTDWDAEKEATLYEEEWEGQKFQHTYAEVVTHVIAHEIHHIGQLSVWLREAGVEPPSPDVL